MDMRKYTIAAAALLGAQGHDMLSLPPAALLTDAPWQVAFGAPSP